MFKFYKTIGIISPIKLLQFSAVGTLSVNVADVTVSDEPSQMTRIADTIDRIFINRNIGFVWFINSHSL